MKFCIDGKDFKDNKDDTEKNDVDNDYDDNDDEYNYVNEHLVKIIVKKQINQMKSMVTNLTFKALFAKLFWGRFRHPGHRLDHRFLD